MPPGQTFTNVQPIPQSFTDVTPIDSGSAPSTATNVRYMVPGQGVQEFTKGSTDEQQFLQRFPGTQPIPGKTGTFQRPLAPNEQIDTESPQVRSARQTGQARQALVAGAATPVAAIAPEILPELGVGAWGTVAGTAGAEGLTAGGTDLALGGSPNEAAKTGAAYGATSALLGAAPKVVSAVTENLPSTQMAAAGQQFKQLQGAIGNHTVAMTDKLGDALTEIKMAADSGTTLPTPVNKFVTRIADLEKGPLTYEEARNFYHNVSDLAASDRMAMNKNAQRLVLQFKNALGETISNTADQAGMLQTYQNAMRGFASGAQLQEKLQTAKDLAVKYGGPALLGEGVYQGMKHLMNLSDFGGH